MSYKIDMSGRYTRDQRRIRGPHSHRSILNNHLAGVQHGRATNYSHGHMRGRERSPSHHRHSSSTTEPSLTIVLNSRSRDDCDISICYSYLIAIGSSFLVVLGIYLSLTNFNHRYLSISLLGLALETLSACFYCMRNVHQSKLARRKQRISSNDSVINGRLQIESRHHHQLANIIQQRQFVTSDVINNRNGVSANHGGDNFEAVHSDPTTDHPNEHNPDIPELSNQSTDAPCAPSRDYSQETAQHNSPSQDHIDSREQLPESSCQNVGPLEATNNVASEPISQLQDDNNIQITATAQVNESFDGDHLNTSAQSNYNRTQIEDNQQIHQHLNSGCDSTQNNQTINNSIHVFENNPTTTQSNDDNTISIQASQPGLVDVTDSIGSSRNQDVRSKTNQNQTISQRHVGLMIPDSHSSPNARKSPRLNHQRLANVRRTLVMGLSGEEELIEIDDNDLDNMSILPPPYESISKQPGDHANLTP